MSCNNEDTDQLEMGVLEYAGRAFQRNKSSWAQMQAWFLKKSKKTSHMPKRTAEYKAEKMVQ